MKIYKSLFITIFLLCPDGLFELLGYELPEEFEDFKNTFDCFSCNKNHKMIFQVEGRK